MRACGFSLDDSLEPMFGRCGCSYRSDASSKYLSAEDLDQVGFDELREIGHGGRAGEGDDVDLMETKQAVNVDLRSQCLIGFNDVNRPAEPSEFYRKVGSRVPRTRDKKR